MNQVRDILRLLDPLANLTRINKVDNIQALKTVQQKLKVKPSQISVLLAVVLLLFLASFFVKVSHIFVWFFCYFFPAYFTLIALRDGNKEASTKYLVYWVLYPLILQGQPLVRLLFNKTIFNFLRVILTVFFLSPTFDLGTRFFESAIRPFLESQKTRAVTGQLDDFVNRGEQAIEQVKNKLKRN